MKRLLPVTTCIPVLEARSDKSAAEESSAGDAACVEPRTK
jgi:hypothetical protein